MDLTIIYSEKSPLAVHVESEANAQPLVCRVFIFLQLDKK